MEIRFQENCGENLLHQTAYDSIKISTYLCGTGNQWEHYYLPDSNKEYLNLCRGQELQCKYLCSGTGTNMRVTLSCLETRM